MSQDTVKTRAHPELRVKAGLRAPEREVPSQPEEPPREEIPRVVRLLALAHRWHRLIDEGEIESQAEIARRVGLTRARVSQILGLAQLAPAVQQWIAFAPEDDSSLSVRCATQVATMPIWRTHVERVRVEQDPKSNGSIEPS